MPIWFCFAFVQLLAERYKIVQPQNLDSMIPAFVSVKIFRGGRIIYDLADFYRDAYALNIPIVNNLSAILERSLIRKVEALILVSDRQVLQVKTKNLPQNVVYFYNTPFPSLPQSFEPENSEIIDRSFFSIFYAGVLGSDRVKLLMKVIDAIRGLPVKFYVAGFGQHQDLLQRLSKSNLQLLFLGKLDNEKIMTLTQKVDLVLLPYDPQYLNNRVGLPNKLFEAMSCGTIVLATRGTYMGEIVEKENIGFVVDYSDPSQLRHQIEELSRKSDSLHTYRDKARKLYKEKFEPQKMGAQYLRLVERIASQ